MIPDPRKIHLTQERIDSTMDYLVQNIFGSEEKI